VSWSTAQGGFWFVSGAEELAVVLRDPITFCSSQGVERAQRHPGMPNIVLLETDPPLHHEFRVLINPSLSPKRSEDMEGEIRTLVTELIDAFIEDGECDLVDALARPLPRAMLLRLLGIPTEDSASIAAMLRTATREATDNPEAAKQAGLQFQAYLGDLVSRSRAANHGDGLLGSLLNATVEGRPIEDDEISRLLIVVFAGGMNTVKGQLGGTFKYLAEHPRNRRRLIENPDLVPGAVEELLRYVSPVHGVFRTVTKEVTLGGQQLRAGDKVYVGFGAANRDERAFQTPSQCRFDRSPNRHVAFGLGHHRCVGSHLARVQVRVALQEVLRRLPDYRIVENAVIRWDQGSVSRGVENLPVVFTPGRRA
jgi:cytochrome P450